MRIVFENSLELGDCPVSSQDQFAFKNYEGEQKMLMVIMFKSLKII